MGEEEEKLLLENDCLGEDCHVRRRDVRSVIETGFENSSEKVKLAGKIL